MSDEKPPEIPLRFRDLRVTAARSFFHIEDHDSLVVLDREEAIALRDWLNRALK